MNTIRLLKNGSDQTLVLPDEFQFDSDEVYIKRMGSVVLLIPKDNPWQSLFDSLNLFSEDFMETRQQPELEQREDLFA